MVKKPAPVGGRTHGGSRLQAVPWTGLLCRFVLALAFVLGVAGARNRVETEGETLAESVADGDAEHHKRDEHRVTRHRAARLLATRGRGVAILAAPLCMAPTTRAPVTRAHGGARRTNPDDDDDDDERRVG